MALIGRSKGMVRDGPKGICCIHSDAEPQVVRIQWVSMGAFVDMEDG